MSIHKIIDVATNQETLLNYSEEELAEQRETQEKLNVLLETLEAKAAQRQAILDRLGLTAEEAALLLGGN